MPWSSVYKDYTIDLSGGGDIAGITNSRKAMAVRVAVDLDAGKIWFGNVWFGGGSWNGDSNLASQNPAAGIGGYSITAIPTPVYPAWSQYNAGGGDNVAEINGGGRTSFPFMTEPPNGFLAWDTLAGSMTKWNSADKDAFLALTNSDFTITGDGTVTHTAIARAQNGLSSGKAYFEIICHSTSSNDTHYTCGIADNTPPPDTIGTNTHSIGWRRDGAIIYNNSSIDNANGYNPSLYSVPGVIAVGGHATGQYYFEVEITTLPSGQNGFGLVNGKHSLQRAAGDSHNASQMVYWGDGHIYYKGSYAMDTFGLAEILGCAVDIDAAKVWFLQTDGQWNNDNLTNQNPATGAGGRSIVDMLAENGTLFPYGAPQIDGATLTLNTFGPFNTSAPSGFTEWGATDDDSGGGAGAETSMFFAHA